jgi:hypothetical protein
MKRDYETGTADNITFFVGDEVEKTPAYGMRTLFVTGVQSWEDIEKCLHDERGSIKHIFFGANHSFNPASVPQDELYDYCLRWDNMIKIFLDEGYWCSLDIPVNGCEAVLEGPLVERDNFIPQIRVPLPYTKLWNYNTMVKIDDVDFKATNPGVWCHSLHDLMDREKFTDWSKYGLDKVIK